MENYQTLCSSCNGKKNNKTDISIEEAIEKGYTTKEIQDTLIILNQKKIELEKLQKEYDTINNKFHSLLPKRDKSEFI